MLPALIAAALLPLPAAAGESRTAVLVTQSLNVGDLADRVGLLAADILRAGAGEVIAPKLAATRLAGLGGPDPIECGTDNDCLIEAGRKLGARWVVAIGIGKLGDTYGLDVRAIDTASSGHPRVYAQSYKEPGPDWTNATLQAVRKVVPEELLSTRSQTSSIEIAANIDGGTVFLDGFPAGVTPLGKPLEVGAGSHAVELRKEGHTTARREVAVTSGVAQRIELYVVPLAQAGGSSTGRTFGFVSAGVGAAALGTALYFHVASLNSANEANQLNAAGKDYTSVKQQSLDEIGTARILYGVTGAAAVAATILFLTATDPAPPPDPSVTTGYVASLPPLDPAPPPDPSVITGYVATLPPHGG